MTKRGGVVFIVTGVKSSAKLWAGCTTLPKFKKLE